VPISALPLKADTIDAVEKSALCQTAHISSPRRLQSFQDWDEIAFLLVRETEIETLVVEFDDV